MTSYLREKLRESEEEICTDSSLLRTCTMNKSRKLHNIPVLLPLEAPTETTLNIHTLNALTHTHTKWSLTLRE